MAGLLSRAWHLVDPSSQFANLAVATSFWTYLAIFLPLCFVSILLRGNGAPEAAIEQVNTIEMIMRRSRLSQAQCGLIWRSLLEKYVSAARPDLAVKPNLVDAYKEVEVEIAADVPPK
ncbi:hypothetical protein BHK69_15080 [Bosea vaviloviae]|uniref:Uncharacterized protein n=2 Tax=Bosea vaviloviae TaxID=1526658 RepID=A0A1D7U2K0_9HYPH|nr:hypothetical protein BHK69_15080 [Bosea vaviloviae]